MLAISSPFLLLLLLVDSSIDSRSTWVSRRLPVEYPLGIAINWTQYLPSRSLSIKSVILNLIRRCRRFFPQRVKATFRTKNVHRKRPDNAGKDKIIDLFLETGKSAGEFWVDAITYFDTTFQQLRHDIWSTCLWKYLEWMISKFSRCFLYVLGRFGT